MSDAAVSPGGMTRRGRGRQAPTFAAGAAAVTLVAVAGGLVLSTRTTVDPVAVAASGAVPEVRSAYAPLLDATYSLGSSPLPLARSVPLASGFTWASVAGPAPPEVTKPEIVTAMAVPVPHPVVAELVEDPPLPAPRPPELQARASLGAVRPSGHRLARQAPAAVPTGAPDDRTFLQRFFGWGRPSGSVLAYATPEDGTLVSVPNLGLGSVTPFDRQTAVYDIAAHTVTLPNGTKLEAHSGLGPLLDDPRHVSARNRGATPPHVYDLTPREQLFHGVQALRLNPVGGGGVFGRTGLLAHTYMLGPNGDSNGCVSFKNYDAFLQAYRNGEVRRLVVVAGRT